MVAVTAHRCVSTTMHTLAGSLGWIGGGKRAFAVKWFHNTQMTKRATAESSSMVTEDVVAPSDHSYPTCTQARYPQPWCGSERGRGWMRGRYELEVCRKGILPLLPAQEGPRGVARAIETCWG